MSYERNWRAPPGPHAPRAKFSAPFGAAWHQHPLGANSGLCWHQGCFWPAAVIPMVANTEKHPLTPHSSLYNLLNFFLTGAHCLCLGRNEARKRYAGGFLGGPASQPQRGKQTSTGPSLEIASVFLTLPDTVCLFGSNWEGLGLLLPERKE